jgi:hypothetical protein
MDEGFVELRGASVLEALEPGTDPLTVPPCILHDIL